MENNELHFFYGTYEIFEDDFIQFVDMFNIVHIDQKWFNLTEVSVRYYPELHKPEPYRQFKSKSNVSFCGCKTKV